MRTQPVPRLLAAAFVATLVTPPATAAQDKLPRSLARLGLPEDPADVPNRVLTRGLPIFHVFEAGCPSDGGWAAAAFAALEKAAETDEEIRWALAASLGARVLSGNLCPSDLPGFEAWLAGQLRRRWSDGAMSDKTGATGEEGGSPDNQTFFLLSYVSLSRDSATRALVRDIAMDSTVADYWRDQAARTMITQRYGEDLGGKDLENDQRYQDAARSVLSDLATGPPLPGFRKYMEEWFSALQARREGRAGLERPDTCRFAPARRVTSNRVVSDLVREYYPDDMKGRGIGGMTGLTLLINEKGGVEKTTVRERARYRQFDQAALRVARRLRYSPALECDKPVPAEVQFNLRFFPSHRREQGGDRSAGTGRATSEPVDGAPPAGKARRDGNSSAVRPRSNAERSLGVAKCITDIT